MPQLDAVINMFDDLYNKRILELAANIPHLGKLASFDASSTKRSKLCGSVVTVYVKMQNGVVAEFSHEVKACALGQAASSIMARNVIGASLPELEQALSNVQAMLKEGALPPSSRFEDMKVLQGVKAFKARHASVLLSFEASVEAVKLAMNQP
jgi:NifU-like protein involved in Fe-S cluster formation